MNKENQQLSTSLPLRSTLRSLRERLRSLTEKKPTAIISQPSEIFNQPTNSSYSMPAKTPSVKVTKVAKTAPSLAIKKAAPKAIKKAAPLAAIAEKKVLVHAEPDTAFWVSDGQILHTLAALKDALAQMDAGTYQYHANKEKNDFASWVESVLMDGDCAAELKKAKTPTAAKTIIMRHLGSYAY